MKTSRRIVTTGLPIVTIAFAAPAYALLSLPSVISAGEQTSGSTTLHAVTQGPVEQEFPGIGGPFCQAGEAEVSLSLGPVAEDVGVAEVTESLFESCVGPLGLDMHGEQTTPYVVDVGSGDGDHWEVTISNINRSVFDNDGLCAFELSGSIEGVFNESAQTLRFSAERSDLSVSDVNGCFGIVNEGDWMTFEAVYDVTTDAGPIAID